MLWDIGAGEVKTRVRLSDYDAVSYLETDTQVAACLNAAMAEEDPNLVLIALNNIARAKGMTAIAEASGLGRESLYKALADGAKPRYDTILRLFAAWV